MVVVSAVLGNVIETTPDTASTVATEVLNELQLPPVAGIIVPLLPNSTGKLLAHNESYAPPIEPTTVPAFGNGNTLIATESLAIPQPPEPETEYTMLTVPGVALPPTTPAPVTVAIDVLRDAHEPPAGDPERLMVAPVHT